MINLIEKLSKSDNFPTDADGNVWVSRDEDANIVTTTDTVQCAVTPPFLFGYFLREGHKRYPDDRQAALDYANEQAEAAGSIREHDFGACVMRDDSIRREADGRWYFDAIPENPRVQKVRVMVAKKDANGNVIYENGRPVPLLDDKGNIQTDLVNKKETFITLCFDMVVAEGDEFSLPFVQKPDAYTRKRIARFKASQKAKEREEAKKAGKARKGGRATIGAAEFAQVLSDQGLA